MSNMSRCDAHHVAVEGHRRRRLGDGFVADRLLVHEAFMREIEQVVVDELIVRAEMMIALHRRPGRVVHPMEIRDAVGIGERRVAQPYPGEAVPLDQRIFADACARRDRVLARDAHANAVAVEAEPMIAALDLIIRRRGRSRAARSDAGSGPPARPHRPTACGTGRSAPRRPCAPAASIRSSLEKAMTCQHFRIHMAVSRARRRMYHGPAYGAGLSPVPRQDGTGCFPCRTARCYCRADAAITELRHQAETRVAAVPARQRLRSALLRCLRSPTPRRRRISTAPGRSA